MTVVSANHRGGIPLASALFSPIRLRGLDLPNRIVVSSMCQYDADDGSANDWHLMHYGQFAMGAAGLVMTEATHVSPKGRISHRCLGLYSDENEEALKQVLDFCHRYGVTAFGVQLGHSGRKGSVRLPQDGGKPLAVDERPWTTVAPSAVPFAPDWPVPRALDEAGLEAVKERFVAAAKRAARIGFDLAELHAGHGYLLHQLLSPLSNRRDDAYGGSLNRRMRFPLEVFEAVRDVWPDDRPLGVRVSVADWVEGGLTVADAIAFCRALAERGCDFADITTGGLDPRQQIEVGPGYQVPLAQAVRAAVDMPVWTVGMITEPDQAEEIIATGKADFVALARGMMWDPRWAGHAAEALGVDTAYSPMYVRCHPSRRPEAFARRRQMVD